MVKASLVTTPPISSINRKLTKIGDEIVDLRKPLWKVGLDIEDESKKHIIRREDFEGRPIRPLKESTIARRERRGTGGDHPLNEYGRMLRSFDTDVKIGKNVSTTRVGPRGRRGGVGNQKKANLHWKGFKDRGGGYVPPRQFMGLNERDIKQTKDEFQKYIKVRIRVVTG